MIGALLHQWGVRLNHWLDLNVVTTDPNPEPSRLDRLDSIGANHIHTAVRESLTDSTTTFAGTDLLTPPQRNRASRAITEAVIEQLRVDLGDDLALADEYARKFPGEHGDVPAIRDGYHGLTGPHEHDDQWREFGRATSDERYADGRGRDL